MKHHFWTFEILAKKISFLFNVFLNERRPLRFYDPFKEVSPAPINTHFFSPHHLKKWRKCQMQYNKKASPMPFGRCFENQMLPLHTSRPHLSNSSYIKPGVWTSKSSIPVSDPQVATLINHHHNEAFGKDNFILLKNHLKNWLNAKIEKVKCDILGNFQTMWRPVIM